MKYFSGILLSGLIFLLPMMAGGFFRFKSLAFTYLSGQFLLWAVFQILAVPAVYFRTEFNILFWIYTGMVLVLSGFGAGLLWRNRKMVKREKGSWRKNFTIFHLLALAVILFQMCFYIFGMHLDEDDSRWVVEANDALITNRMLLHNPATGEYIGEFIGEMVKDVFSPWPMYLAWLSRCTGISAIVMAHTVLPPVLLGLSYVAYYEIGAQLFVDIPELTDCGDSGEGNKGKKKKQLKPGSRRQERGIFLLMVTMINMFMAGNGYTQGAFTLKRIWQGKAVVAAVIIPAVFCIILRIQSSRDSSVNILKHEQNKIPVADWLLLILSGISACLLSGMGIAIALLMIGIYGSYILVIEAIRIIRDQKRKKADGKPWKGFLTQAGLWIASMLPSIVFGFGYFRLK